MNDWETPFARNSKIVNGVICLITDGESVAPGGNPRMLYSVFVLNSLAK